MKLLADPGGVLMTILFLNEIMNITLSTLVANAIAEWTTSIGRPEMQTLVTLLISVPIVLFIGEITPKIIGARMNRIIAPVASRPIYFLYMALKPIRAIFATAKFVVSRVKQNSLQLKRSWGNNLNRFSGIQVSQFQFFVTVVIKILIPEHFLNLCTYI